LCRSREGDFLPLPTPMLSALFPCFRSITPGQREAFSDQGLTRIPTACTNPGEGAPVAVLPVSIDLHTLDPEQLSKLLLRLESCYQLGMTLVRKSVRDVVPSQG
jgi:hypothetical protein